MGYAIVFGVCFCCKRTFGFNPHSVPSITAQGERQPICRTCIDRANPRRIANGLDPIVPAADAYEPIQEHEL